MLDAAENLEALHELCLHPRGCGPGVGCRAPRRASCRAAAEPRGRLVGVLDLVSFGNCRWHVESVLPADVVRSAIAHDEIDVALNDVERQGGHLQSILTLVFRDAAAFRLRRNPIIYRANPEMHRVADVLYESCWRLAHSSSGRDVCVTSFFLSFWRQRSSLPLWEKYRIFQPHPVKGVWMKVSWVVGVRGLAALASPLSTSRSCAENKEH